jgi:transcriptional regulator with XRE-family HTH domain/tetratricopeptide (TPR) repeat protein
MFHVQNAADDLRVLVGLLRLLKARSQDQMATAAEIGQSTLSRFERGKLTPDRPALEKLARASLVPLWAIDGILLPALAVVRRLSSRSTVGSANTEEAVIRASLAAEHGSAGVHVAEFLLELDGEDGVAPHSDSPESVVGRDPWVLLNPPAGNGAADLDVRFDLEDLVARICHDSEEAAAHDAADALALARRALRIAELAPKEATWRLRLQGYAWAFGANALRVASDLSEAEVSFLAAWRLWRASGSPPMSRLQEWRLLDLEASLRRDRRQFSAALDLLRRALDAAPPKEAGRILLNKATTFEQAGEIEAALVTLREAAPLVEEAGEPRQRWAVRFNLLVILSHLGRFAEAEMGLPELRLLAEQLGNDFDGLRLRWLAARVSAGLGRCESACAAFEAVQREFSLRRIPYDAALVSLELAIVYLQQDRLAEVETLANEMAWIFQSQGVAREALAALALFCEAVAQNIATVDLARHLMATVERAQKAAQSGPKPSA